ncbi:MAG: radical SAM family heme chaperone HemW [Chitinophagales bacterium]|nr:radical SAM family heme chaperone HemW [Chitinophagaceae bacterium]MCB9065155.1 radical SAM family heme chaperone HemW [Chitinophagales bacterium]
MAGIYIHIPFCKQACNYCNFHFSTSLKFKSELLEALTQELEMQRDYLQGMQVQTIYFGGGTPSLLSADEVNRIVDKISQHYNLNNLKEVTLEANPDDLTQQHIKDLRRTSVNRFSIGIQSFFDRDLQYMNRAHNAQEADYAIKASQDAGFTNLTIDLIYGTPGLSDVDWQHNLSRVQDLSIPHFSSYALTVEEGTALHHNIKVKKTTPVDAEQSAAQFEILMAKAKELGYQHYEISNLALPGHRAIHNTNYWKGVPYLGIGPSAHSFDGKTRRWNIANNALYIKSILTDKKSNYEEEVLTQKQQLNEYIMTSLRTMWGIDLNKVATQWGSDTVKTILNTAEQFIEYEQAIHKDNTLVLTDKGRLFADHIAGELFL